MQLPQFFQRFCCCNSSQWQTLACRLPSNVQKRARAVPLRAPKKRLWNPSRLLTLIRCGRQGFRIQNSAFRRLGMRYADVGKVTGSLCLDVTSF
jgi:hypothetical protein